MSGGYFHGYFNGIEYPFYYDGYLKSQLYTRAQVDSLINGLKTRIATLESNANNGYDWSKFRVFATESANHGNLILQFYNVPIKGDSVYTGCKYVDFSLGFWYPGEGGVCTLDGFNFGGHKSDSLNCVLQPSFHRRLRFYQQRLLDA